ncbi:LysR family transcriptional regulator [Nocardioides sp.]|uniref:LysR family transcriptional regulator n=1 Tax=Nocardioides sp. TaxID=35761 RepID=UPI00272606F5|nr:LysR family transcriptional regulator [Nocardioides sp.]MDO9457526.1 LysR family transcriptional regulator [Nocardioides sp.]
MDLRQLECFVAVADRGGFTRAAEALGVTQPGISAQVARLEREVGEPLFERAGRGGARLTAAGRAALGPARAALASTDVVRSAVADVAGLTTGRVALGHVSSGASATLVEPLSELRRAHPAIEVSLVEDRSEQLLARVLGGELDLAWVGVAGGLPAGLESRTVLDERLVLGVPDDHRWAGRRSVTLAAAIEEPLVAMPAGTGARAALDAALTHLSAQPRIAFECSSPDLIGALVRRGHGLAVLPEELARVLGLVVVPLTRPSSRSRLVLVWRRGGPTTPAARALLAIIGGQVASKR